PTPIPEPELGDQQPEALPPLELAAPLPAPEPQPEPVDEALPPSELLAELDFAPVAELAAPEETPLAPHAAPAGDFEVAASSMWDLLPAPDAAQPAAEQQAQLPGGWPGDDASGHLDELHFAGGGSFDEATAPIVDLSPERLVEAYPPGVDLTPDPDAFEALPTPPEPATASRAPAAGSDELPTLDLAGLGLEAAADVLPVSLEPEVSIDLGFVEDDLAPASPWAPTAAAAAPARPAERAPAPEMDWAAELAVPAGDGAVDLASFEAAPEEQPAAREGTAMWGLAGLPGTARVAAKAFAAPLPQDDPWDAPAAAKAAPPALELAPADGPGPFDLGEPEPAAEPLPLAALERPVAEPEVLEATDEQILEVGTEVIEIGPADDPAEIDAAAPAAVAPIVAAPPEPEPAPQPVLAPAAPAPTAPEAPTAPASSYVAGPHRVVVHTADGQVKRGILCDVALDGPEVLLQPQAGGAAEALPAERIKAIFFMLATGDAPPAPEGKKVRVTFRDGRQVAGFSPDYQPD
ncbi:MAG TPA: hypothetical protein VF400_00980, partial [Anaeromyxobacteraceae bacterium]